jgi:hypothetical protein
MPSAAYRRASVRNGAVFFEYLSEVHINGRLPNGVVVSTLGLAVRPHHRQFMGYFVNARRDQVVRICEARYQQQGLAFPIAARVKGVELQSVSSSR